MPNLINSSKLEKVSEVEDAGVRNYKIVCV